MGTAPILTASMSSETALFQRLAWFETASWRSSRRVAIWVCVASVWACMSVRAVWTVWVVWRAWTDTDESTDDTDCTADTDDAAAAVVVVTRVWVACWAWAAVSVMVPRRAARLWRRAIMGGSLFGGELG